MLELVLILYIFYFFPFVESNLNVTSDSFFMRKAINLAAKARGHTRPNPCVGCVIVDSNYNIVGEGYHVMAGQDHAEVVALKQAGSRANGA